MYCSAIDFQTSWKVSVFCLLIFGEGRDELASLFGGERKLISVVESDRLVLPKVSALREGQYWFLVRTYLRKFLLESYCGDLHMNAFHMNCTESHSEPEILFGKLFRVKSCKKYPVVKS